MHANVMKVLRVFKSQNVSVDTTFEFVPVSVKDVKQILLDIDLAVSSYWEHVISKSVIIKIRKCKVNICLSILAKTLK